MAPQLSMSKPSHAIEEALDPTFGSEYQLRVLREFVVPVAPDAALRLVKRLVLELLQDDLSDEGREHVAAALELLDGMAQEQSAEVADVIDQVQLRPDLPELCALFLQVAASAGHATSLDSEVLRAGATETPEGARAALRCLLVWEDVDDDHVGALIDGVVAHAAAIDAVELARAVTKHREVMTPVDQLGAIASAGAPELAEQTAEELGLRRGLIRALFSAARRVHDLELVERRLRYVESWSHASAQDDREAVDGYIGELERVANEARFKTVIESLLRYFPIGSTVPNRTRLREAVFNAMTRLQPITDDELQQLLEDARTQLSLETPSTRDRVSRLFRRIFRND